MLECTGGGRKEKVRKTLNTVWERFYVCSVSASLINQGKRQLSKRKAVKAKGKFGCETNGRC